MGIFGWDGTPLNLANLPSLGPIRWGARRKAEVLAAVSGGLLSMEAACARYEICAEEFLAWRLAVDRFGLKGLRATGLAGRCYPRH
jgi:hypothetical protein